MAASELPPGAVVEVLVGDRPVALCNVAGQVRALDGTCPHAGGPLGDGVLEGGLLTCPWHGWAWDTATGRSTVDESKAVDTVPVVVVSGGVWLPPPV